MPGAIQPVLAQLPIGSWYCIFVETADTVELYDHSIHRCPMNTYAIRYFDEGGNGWTRLVQADNLKEAVIIGRCDPDMVRIQEIIQTNTHLNHADL